jgi:transcriptional regulator with XRE-family HTH domain
MVIFDKLVKIRKEKKVSQGDMSVYLGITPATLSRYEKKRRSIPGYLVEKYAYNLGYELKLMIK